MTLPDDLRRRADDQLGVVSRRQLLEGGLTRAEIRWRLGNAGLLGGQPMCFGGG